MVNRKSRLPKNLTVRLFPNFLTFPSHLPLHPRLSKPVGEQVFLDRGWDFTFLGLWSGLPNSLTWLTKKPHLTWVTSPKYTHLSSKKTSLVLPNLLTEINKNP